MVKDNRDMEVRINGEAGPSIKFRIGLMAIIQVVVVLATFMAAMRVVSADVDRLKQQNDTLQREVILLRETQAKILSALEDLRDEMRYYREKLDRHVIGGR